MPGLSRGGRRQAGITLLESLVALMILVLGVLGTLAVHVRTLAETQTGVRRGQAVRLIEDLGERIKSNPGGYAVLAGYVADWDTMPTAAVDCRTAACGPADLARWDLADWKRRVAETLPLGKARLFESADEAPAARHQLGVVVGWRANEREGDPALRTPLQEGGIACPAGLLCHVAHVQP